MAQNLAYDEDYLNLLPSKWWVNFFKKFAQIDTLPVHDWKPIHQLSHLTIRYKEFYNKRFSFSLKGRPSGCTEVFQIKRMMAVLGTSNQNTVKNYIDWVFDKKIIPLNAKIRSIGYFTNAQFCNEFHLQRIEASKIGRATELPSDYQEIIDGLDLSIYTYGDLAFAKQALDSEPVGREVYDKMFNELYSIGFEYSVLRGLR